MPSRSFTSPPAADVPYTIPQVLLPSSRLTSSKAKHSFRQAEELVCAAGKVSLKQGSPCGEEGEAAKRCLENRVHLSRGTRKFLGLPGGN